MAAETHFGVWFDKALAVTAAQPVAIEAAMLDTARNAFPGHDHVSNVVVYRQLLDQEIDDTGDHQQRRKDQQEQQDD